MRAKHLLFGFVVATSLAGAGCISISIPSVERQTFKETARPTAAFGSATVLKVGGSATYSDGLAVTLKQINDSRCPKDVQCVWQGELAPVFTFSGGKLSAETELVLGTVRGLSGTVGNYAVTASEVTEKSAAVTVSEQAAAAESHDDLIRVTSPTLGEEVTSPLVVTGEARGFWFFEASFPVKLLDADGKAIAVAPAQAQGDWMTEEFVPFAVSLAFEAPPTSTGTLVLEKDNPSGLPENADEIRLPVRFAPATGSQRAVKLYFYDYSNDRDETGNAMCSRQGLSPVDRKIPFTNTPIQDTIRLLLKGGLTDAERASGISTEFPLYGVELKGTSLKDGELTLEFADPMNRTGGGSCRVGILWSQIEATALQFPEVKSVRFMPEDLFQP